MILGQRSCPAEVHCIPLFCPAKLQIFKVGGVSHPHTPLSFTPVCTEYIVLPFCIENGQEDDANQEGEPLAKRQKVSYDSNVAITTALVQGLPVMLNDEGTVTALQTHYAELSAQQQISDGAGLSGAIAIPIQVCVPIISFSFKNYVYRLEAKKGIYVQTCPVFTLITLITRKKLSTIKVKRKNNNLNQVRKYILVCLSRDSKSTSSILRRKTCMFGVLRRTKNH